MPFKTKIRNRRRVYEFWLSKEPRWSYAKVGRIFHVTRERVRVIINRERNNDHQDAL